MDEKEASHTCPGTSGQDTHRLNNVLVGAGFLACYESPKNFITTSISGDMKQFPILKDRLCTEPHSGFYKHAGNDIDSVYMLLQMDSCSLARALFLAAESLGESLHICICAKKYYVNFAFIFIDKEFADEESEHLRKKIVSKKYISEKLSHDGFVSIHDELETDKKSFVDCLVNRNIGMDKFYRLIRKSIPLVKSKTQTKSLLNVMSSTNDEKVKILLSQKNITSLGLLHRFVFISKQNAHEHSEDKDCVNTFVDFVKESMQYKDALSLKIRNRDHNAIIELELLAYEELKRCIFIRGHAKSLTDLYSMLLIKISAIIQMLRSKSIKTNVHDEWKIADVLARKLLNEKICVLEKHSKSLKLFHDLRDYICERTAFRQRDLLRKFQYADRSVLMHFVEYFMGMRLIYRTKLNAKNNIKNPATFYIVKEFPGVYKL